MHEAPLSFGVGAEVAARIAEKAIYELSAPDHKGRVAEPAVPVPGLRELLYTEREEDSERDRQGLGCVIPMKEIKFIDVGEGITEGHVRQWLVKDGDQVKEDQPVVRVETDKAVVNVPSPISGTIRQNVKENTDVHLGDTIAYIGTPDEIRSASSAAPSQAASSRRPPLAKRLSPQRSSPAPRKRNRRN